MKKILIIALVIILGLLSYIYVFKTEETEIKLPFAENIVEIKISRKNVDNNIKYDKPEDIAKIIEDFQTMIKTKQESISDAPNVPDWFLIKFVHKTGGESNLYVYEKEDVYYIEQPYEGIWILEKNPQTWLEGQD